MQEGKRGQAIRGLPGGADVVMGRQGVLPRMRPKADKDREM